MNRILISMEEGRAEPDWLGKIEPYMQAVMKKLGYDGEELSVLFCGDDFIHNLNKEYRQIDSATDILSFEGGDEYEDEEGCWKCAGDIIISLETLPVNAKYFSTDENTELKRLLIHGILHLNGMDHGEAHVEPGVEPTDEMLKLQESVLKEFKDEKLI